MLASLLLLPLTLRVCAMFQHGYTALMYAAQRGYHGMAEFLISRGARCEERNNVRPLRMLHLVPPCSRPSYGSLYVYVRLCSLGTLRWTWQGERATRPLLHCW